MSQFKNEKLKRCHRRGHEIVYGESSRGLQVKVCKKCGDIWRRSWIKDITLTSKNKNNEIDFTNYVPSSEEQVNMNEVGESN